MASLQRVVWNNKILSSNRPSRAVYKSIVPEHERPINNRFGISLFNRHTILIDELRLACFAIHYRHSNQLCHTPTLPVYCERLGNFSLAKVW